MAMRPENELEGARIMLGGGGRCSVVWCVSVVRAQELIAGPHLQLPAAHFRPWGVRCPGSLTVRTILGPGIFWSDQCSVPSASPALAVNRIGASCFPASNLRNIVNASSASLTHSLTHHCRLHLIPTDRLHQDYLIQEQRASQWRTETSARARVRTPPASSATSSATPSL